MSKLADYQIMRGNHVTSSTPTSYKRGLRKPFIPPTRTRPLDAIKLEAQEEVKVEPIEILEDEDPITLFEGERAVQDDLKPDIELIDVKPAISKLDGKRKRSLSTEVRDVKPIIRGSRERPISIRDDEEEERGLQRIPPPINQHQQVINKVVYNITYNIINVIQPPGTTPSEIAPPAYAPLPGLGEPGPSGPPAGFPLDEAPALPNVPFQPSPLPQIEPNPDMPVLSKAQKRILDTVLEGKSVLIHGSAGTGKSVLIRAIKQAFDQRFKAHYPDEPKPDPTAGNAVDRAKVSGDYSRISMTAEERVMNPLPEKKWKLRVTASTGLAAVYVPNLSPCGDEKGALR